MFRIDTPNKAVDLFGAGKHGFRDGDQALGVNPTELSAAQQNALQEELAGVCEAAGIVLNKANNAQVLEAIQRLIDAQSGNYALDTGAANAYVVALSPAIAAYGDGMTVRVKAANANTGASTLNAGAGVVGLVNDVGGALAAGDIPAGGIITATYIASAAKFYITSLVQSQGDARYAMLTGNQTINGINTFAGQLIGKGTVTNDSAAAGMIGEHIESVLPVGSAVALTNNMSVNITSISLTAGDWIVFGNIGVVSGGSAAVTMLRGGSAITSASLPAENAGGFSDNGGITINSGATGYVPIAYPSVEIKLAAPTTIYLVGYALFSVATLSMFGRISARRTR